LRAQAKQFDASLTVMAGLGPAIHAFASWRKSKTWIRDKRGDDSLDEM
jgi:hypothetical protein